MRTITAILVVVFCLYASLTYASGSYKKYNLPYGISVEIPIGWKILDKNTNRQLDNFTEALSGKNQSNNQILLAANCYTKFKTPSATFRISIRKTTPDISQYDLQNITPSELNILKKQALTSSEHSNKTIGTKINLYTQETDIEKISGLYSILTSKVDKRKGFPSFEMFYLVPVSYGYIKIYTTYNKNEEFFIPILDKILSSIKIGET